MSSGRRKGPIGGIIGMLGTGVGAVAEYREHRKEQKLSRESSNQEVGAEVRSSGSRPQAIASAPSFSTDVPPAYTEVVGSSSDRTLAPGKPVSPDKKAALAQYEDDDSSDDDDDDDSNSTEDDEEDWELDELEREDSTGLPSYNESEQHYGNTDELVRDVMSKRTQLSLSPTQQELVRTPLPCPVVIPQRRPRNKTRGFVRAYAPVLGEHSGIDQDTFLSFLDNFYKSSQASPVFGVIQLSAAIAGLVPEPITMAVTTAVQVGARVGEEVQSRHRRNDFMDKMNDQLFKPAGLYAMIVKYKSDAEVQASGNSMLARFGVGSETVDFNTNQTIAKYDRNLSDGSSGDRSMSERLQNLRLASGTTKGSINLPAAAPLIFPDIDKAIAKDGPETFKDKAKDAQTFLGDYIDRRAQLRYARDDPSSKLVIPESERTFKSKLADPEHPMYNSGPIGFLSGGYLARDRGGMTPRQAKRERKYAKHERRMERRVDKYEKRLDSGRDLSRKKQRRYDDYLAQEQMYGQAGYTNSDRGYDTGRRRRGGPIGLVGGLVGGAVNAASGGSRSKEYEDSYGNRPVPHAEYGRRSFDDRNREFDQDPAYAPQANAPAQYAPYGRAAPSYDRRYRDPRRNKQRKAGPIGMVKRAMREDVLYLMIVNMPSEAEMEIAREKLERAKSGH